MLKTPLAGPDAGRLASVDIFRGLVILVMIFVNDVAGVTGLPWWTYHMRPHLNGMTYVDMVFPFFLFIMGMAVPLAMERRIAKGDKPGKLSLHIVLRSFGLVVIGVVLANQERFDPAAAGIDGTLWRVLALAGVFLGWNAYPRTGRVVLYRILKYAGYALVATMLILYRGHARHGGGAWLQFGYLEILGLIGCAYLYVGFFYLALRKRPLLFAPLLAVLLGLNVWGRVGYPDILDLVFGQARFDANMCMITMAGVVASLIVFNPERSLNGRFSLGGIYGAVLLTLGAAFSPLGISKNEGTPAWGLLSAGAAMLMFLALYWLADVKGKTAWAAFVHPAGSNTLTTYLLPDVWYVIPVLGALMEPWSAGFPGVIRSFVFTGMMLGLAALCTKAKIRLQL